MSRHITTRLIQMVFVILGIATFLFILLRLSGDPALLIAGGESAAPEVVERIRNDLGFDRPILEQYWAFMVRLVRLDFGESYFLHEPAMELVLRRLPATLQLSLIAFSLTLILAFPIGIVSGVNRDSLLGRFLMILAFLGQTMPAFWLGIMLILIFSVRFHLLPSYGHGEVKHLIMPALTIAGFSMARIARLVRSGMIEVLSQDYIRTARAKGASEGIVIRRHAIKNMLIPIVTVFGMQIGFMVGGSVIAETIFSYPGIGSQLVQAVGNRDYPVVQATVFLVAVAVVVANLLVDIAYTFLNPRIRYD